MGESVERTKTVKFKTFRERMLFEEYRLLIEDTARFSDRRHKFSNFMVAMNGFLVTGIYAVLKDLSAHDPCRVVILVPLLGVGLAAGCVWQKLFIEYDEMIRARIKFLKQIECKAGKGDRDGLYHFLGPQFYHKEGRERGFTRLEKRLPWIFIGVYSLFMAGVFLAGICWLCLILANCLFPFS